MDFFVKMVNVFQPLTIVIESSILDVWQHFVYILTLSVLVPWYVDKLLALKVTGIRRNSWPEILKYFGKFTGEYQKDGVHFYSNCRVLGNHQY